MLRLVDMYLTNIVQCWKEPTGGAPVAHFGSTGGTPVVRAEKGGFMLGEDLERNISEAWLRLWPWIKRNPDELGRRLARRRMKSLTRPARPWCIAIRASDRRISAAHWVIWPEHAMDLDHPEHPYEPIEHAVTIQKHAMVTSGGKTYAELDREDPKRQIVMTASFLRASLFTSVVSFGVALMAAAIGVGFILGGWALRRLATLA